MLSASCHFSRNGGTYELVNGPIPAVTSYTLAVSNTVMREVRAVEVFQ